jgi:hypothetical protein
VRGDDDQGHGDQQVKGSGRLERTLEKLFDRVDANHDGSVDKGELANALAQTGPSTAPMTQPTPATSTAPTTYVAVAVEQYTAIGQMR